MKNVAIFLILSQFIISCNCYEKIIIQSYGYTDKYFPSLFLAKHDVDISHNDYKLIVEDHQLNQIALKIYSLNAETSESNFENSWGTLKVEVVKCNGKIDNFYLTTEESHMIFKELNVLFAESSIGEYEKHLLKTSLNRISRYLKE